MPFYEYQCAACQAHHEELQKVSDPPLRKCPSCGRSMLRRLVSAPVFRLKGGGWYETDFKADSEAKRNIAGEKEPAPAEAPAEGKAKDDKAEAKPAAKEGGDAPAKPAADAKPSGPAAAAKTKTASTRVRAARRPRAQGRRRR